MSEQRHSAERDVAPVQTVGCSWCGAEPGDECTGPGVGWHLSRWDRLTETRLAVRDLPPTEDRA